MRDKNDLLHSQIDALAREVEVRIQQNREQMAKMALGDIPSRTPDPDPGSIKTPQLPGIVTEDVATDGGVPDDDG